MKTKIHAITTLVILVLVQDALCATDPLQPPSSRTGTTPTPQNWAITPPSSYQKSTTPGSVNEYGQDAGLGAMGNRSRFRGIVPYGSAYETNVSIADPGISAVTAFQRYSADPYRLDSGTANTRSYYQPPRRVYSYLQRTQRDMNNSGDPASWAYQPPPVSTGETRQNYIPQRPLQTGTRISERRLLDEIKLAQRTRQPEKDISQDYYMEPLPKPTETSIEPLKQQVKNQQVQGQLPLPADKTPQGLDADVQDSPANPLLQRLSELRTAQQQQNQVKPRSKGSAQDQPPAAKQDDTAATGLPKPPLLAEKTPGQGQLPGSSDLSVSETEAAARCAEHLIAAEKLLKAGRYYQAVDAYILASVWDGKNPKVWAGRAFALFAAGEYMSSSYYLEKALTVSPQYAGEKTRPAEFIGDRDVFEDRMLELSSVLSKTSCGELAFLMGYMLYQDDKLAAARETLRTAVEKMPGSAAVKTLKEAIEAAAKPQTTK